MVNSSNSESNDLPHLAIQDRRRRPSDSKYRERICVSMTRMGEPNCRVLRGVGEPSSWCGGEGGGRPRHMEERAEGPIMNGLGFRKLITDISARFLGAGF